MEGERQRTDKQREGATGDALDRCLRDRASGNLLAAASDLLSRVTARARTAGPAALRLAPSDAPARTSPLPSTSVKSWSTKMGSSRSTAVFAASAAQRLRRSSSARPETAAAGSSAPTA